MADKVQKDLYVAASPSDSDVDPSKVIGRSEGHEHGWYGYRTEEEDHETFTFAGAAKALNEVNAAGGVKADKTRDKSPQSSK
jgi:hypothetical protein